MELRPYYHFGRISRNGKGKNSVKEAAYQSGSILCDARTGRKFNYSGKTEVVYSEILLPPNAPERYSDRSTLWNSVEKVENRSNAYLARTLLVSLFEDAFTLEDNIRLVREYLNEAIVSMGIIADFAVHTRARGANTLHAHIMMSTRPMDADGNWKSKWEKKETLSDDGKVKNGYFYPWDRKRILMEWRKEWEIYVNMYLERYGYSERINLFPFDTKGVPHLKKVTVDYGSFVNEMNNIPTVKGMFNRIIDEKNEILERNVRSMRLLKDSYGVLQMSKIGLVCQSGRLLLCDKMKYIKEELEESPAELRTEKISVPGEIPEDIEEFLASGKYIFLEDLVDIYVRIKLDNEKSRIAASVRSKEKYESLRPVIKRMKETGAVYREYREKKEGIFKKSFYRKKGEIIDEYEELSGKVKKLTGKPEIDPDELEELIKGTDEVKREAEEKVRALENELVLLRHARSWIMKEYPFIMEAEEKMRNGEMYIDFYRTIEEAVSETETEREKGVRDAGYEYVR